MFFLISLSLYSGRFHEREQKALPVLISHQDPGTAKGPGGMAPLGGGGGGGQAKGVGVGEEQRG